MKIANFGVEEWLNKWEKKAVYDIARSIDIRRTRWLRWD